MPVEEVAKDIYRIPVSLPGNPLRELNSYLIKDAKRSLLIDTGFRLDACMTDLLAGLEELKEDPSQVDIFVTHMHADHTGNAMAIAGEDCAVMISDVDLLWVNGDDAAQSRWNRNELLYARAGMALSDESFIPGVTSRRQASSTTQTPPQNARAFTGVGEGHVFHVGGRSLRCILTPGHTPGHMCLWDEDEGLMLTGDHVLFDISPNITVWGTENDALGEYIQALEMIKTYPVKQAIPGHRKPGDFHVRIDELCQHHEKRVEEILGIVEKHPGASGHDIASMMSWRIRANSWAEFPYSQKVFAVGECMAHLEYLYRRNALRIDREGELNHYYLA